MYKLIIVDDEQSIRNGMANGIPWNDWGFEVIGQASDGLEALELVENERPDVVLSNIRMPRMDGVELMQRLHKDYPDVKVIILSGYSDFEYLNTAIKNSVTEYLLKPTDIDEFEETFKNLKKRIDSEREHSDELKKSKTYYLDNILNLMLLGYMDDEIIEADKKIVENFGININNCAIGLLCIDWKEDIHDKKEIYKKSVDIVEICNSIAENEKKHCHFFMTGQNEIATVISKDGSELHIENCIEAYEDIVKKLREKTGEKAYISVGGYCRDSRMIPQSFEQALSTAHYMKFDDEKTVIPYSNLEDAVSEYHSVNFDYKIINESIMKNDKEKIIAEIERVVSFFTDNSIKDYKYIEQIFLELLFYLSRWSMSYNINFEQIMNLAGVRYEDIRRTVGIEKRKNILITVIDELCECVGQTMNHLGKNNSIARTIKECVDKEYMENFMSLEYAAGKVKKSAAYVSKLFKDEFGCNFSEYVTRKRLEKSKELLDDPTKKVYEIAQELGYADVSNFIKVFKKVYGISPGDYRNFVQR